MLYPQSNRCRTILDLSGFWEIKVDSRGLSHVESYKNGFTADAFIGVPGSWNEQLAELGLMTYVGSVWYQKTFWIPDILSSKTIWLYFGSVDYYARIWINGNFVGEHAGGYLPIVFDITAYIEPKRENRLVLCVNNELSHDTIPQGVTPHDFSVFGKQRDQTYPATAFDFFAFGGIHRPVKLMALAPLHVHTIETQSQILETTGVLAYKAYFSQAAPESTVHVSVWDDGKKIAEDRHTLEKAEIQGEFSLSDCKFWSPETPHLYQLCIDTWIGATQHDSYCLDVGIREVRVERERLLLNKKPVFMKGFGRHEDFAVLGKGLSFPLMVKDFQLMKWMGSNSFRTSHYPYAEEMLQMADRLGFLVIDEVPAVSLNFRNVTETTLENHKAALTELIQRDRNHPSVIAWSVANEPGIWGEPEAVSPKAEQYWIEIFRHVRSLDDSRPITIPACAVWGEEDPVFKYVDFISINRYWGWYEYPAELETAGEILREELYRLYNRYQKPILVSEFGADTIEGLHSTSRQLFTEEYQIALILKYFEVIESLPFTIGEHIWNFADFRTAQHYRRVVLNKKGLFTRNRDPKMAAFAVRNHWLQKDDGEQWLSAFP